MQTTGIRKVLAGLIGLALCAGGARATDYTWYVDQNVVGGDGSGSSWENATTTIDGAITKVDNWLDANWGGTRDGHASDSIYIVVREGTYVESVKPGANENGSVFTRLVGSNTGSAPLYIQSEFWDTTGKLNTIVQAPANPQNCFYMREYGGAFGNWTVRGFTMRHDFTGATQDYRNGLLDSAGSGTVENNIIEVVNTTGSTFRWYGIGNAADLVITDNVIRKLGSGGYTPTALYMGSNNEVYNNLLVVNGAGTTGYEVTVQMHENGVNNQIHHNIIMGYPSVEAVLGMPGYWVASNTKTNEFYANIIANAGRMVDMGGPANTAESTVFYNNTFYSGEYIHCYSDPDTFFNNLIAGNFSWGDGVYFDGFDHTVALGYDDYNDGTNYYRAASTIFETTTLPSGWTNMLPDELSESGWLRPIKGTTYPGISSLDGYNASATDVYGVSYLDGPQIGAVSPPHPKGTVVSVK
jgi:hypothetical protein